MLAILGYLMVVVFMFLIMTKRLTALIALMLIPALFAIVGGFTNELGEMALTGIKELAPTGVMLMFAILYFGIMIDAGLFDPVVGKILQVVKGDPLKITVGTAVLVLIISLDGDGTTTYMITISAMLPLYKRVGMNPLILASIAVLGNAVMNITPWAGAMARVVSALHVEMSDVFVPLIPAMAGGILWVIFTAYVFGLRERKRLGVIDLENLDSELIAYAEQAATVEQTGYKRPKLLWVNFGLTVLLMTGLIMGIMPLQVLFMLGFAIAIMINYPNIDLQKERISAHAGNVLAVASLVFAAGIFTGILSGTKMVAAMANSLVSIIPDALGPYFPVITAIVSLPFTFFMSNDAYYFGILPILAEAASTYGVDSLDIARASLMGPAVHLLSPLVASTYLLVGMSKVDFGEFQRFAFPWAIGTSVIMILVSIAVGAISL
ncbi:CitMHS family transporter [Ectobacillus funiculus]|uniref:CitMHS family transporter n=1 Tax=Ectobacillus funiculus TaxID=137993 RepID=UPI00397E57DB